MSESSSRSYYLITGANRGIGQAIVRALLNNPANHVMLCTRRSTATFELLPTDMTKEQREQLDTEKKIEEHAVGTKLELPNGAICEFVQLDIDNAEQLQSVAQYVLNTYGGLNGIVHNAGIALGDDEFRLDVIDDDMRTNYFSTKNAIKAFYPAMRAHGRIVVISSVSGNETIFELKNNYGEAGKVLYNRFMAEDITEAQIDELVAEYRATCENGDREARGWPRSPYGVTKAALTTFVRVCGRDYTSASRDDIKEDVLISACCPGYCHTGLTGFQGFLTTDQGAVAPLLLLELPSDAPNGKFYSQGQVTSQDYFNMDDIMKPASEQPHLKVKA